MKKTFTALCLAALLALPLVGCTGRKSAGSQTDGAQPPMSTAVPGTGSGDLAGADGVVGGSGSGVTGSPDAGIPGSDGGVNGRLAGGGAMEQIGDGIMNSMEDLGRGARRAMDDMGIAARQAGQEIRQALQ